MDSFVKTETKTTILETKNGNGPDYTYVSIVPSYNNRKIDLVIGAHFSARCASGFSKESLGELIKILQKVHDAMVEL